MPILPSHSKSYSLEAQLRGICNLLESPEANWWCSEAFNQSLLCTKVFGHEQSWCSTPIFALCPYAHTVMSLKTLLTVLFSFEECPVYCFSLYRGQNPRPKSRWKFSPDNSLLNYKKMTSWHICNHPATTNRCKIIFGLTTSQLSNSPV